MPRSPRCVVTGDRSSPVGGDFANPIAQRVDIRHQQVRAPIKQVYGKKKVPPGTRLRR
jgi:hypothetical protein